MRVALEGCYMCIRYKTLDEAWAASKSVIESTGDVTGSELWLPHFQWYAYSLLDELHDQFKINQSSYDAMSAIAICAKHSIPVPDWAAEIYLDGFNKIDHLIEKSWDDVFARPIKKGGNRNAQRKKHITKYAVWSFVYTCRLKGESVDSELFEKAAKQFKIGKTLASEYYYEANNELINTSADN